MDHCSKRTLLARVIFTGILLPALIVGPMIFAFYFYSKRVMMHSYLAKARAVCLTADSIKSWQGCEFVPIAVSDKYFDLNFAGGGSFNRKRLKEDGLTDFYIVDHSENLLCYTHFVRARKTCLDCHGDPRKSKKLWVNQDRQKGLSGDLVGWAVGDVCGAYEVITPLSGAGKEIASASAIAGFMLVAGISIYAIVLLAVVSYVINQRSDREKEKEKEPGCSDSEIYDFGRTDKASDRVH